MSLHGALPGRRISFRPGLPPGALPELPGLRVDPKCADTSLSCPVLSFSSALVMRVIESSAGFTPGHHGRALCSHDRRIARTPDPSTTYGPRAMAVLLLVFSGTLLGGPLIVGSLLSSAAPRLASTGLCSPLGPGVRACSLVSPRLDGPLSRPIIRESGYLSQLPRAELLRCTGHPCHRVYPRVAVPASRLGTKASESVRVTAGSLKRRVRRPHMARGPWRCCHWRSMAPS